MVSALAHVGETGVAYKRGHSSLEPWRVQAGVEYQSALGPCGQRFACYAAADVSAMQEREWRVDVTTDFGIVIRGAGRASRSFSSGARAAQQ